MNLSHSQNQTTYEHGENDIGAKKEQVLRSAFDLDAHPSSKRKEGLAIYLELPISLVDAWYCKQRSTFPESSSQQSIVNFDNRLRSAENDNSQIQSQSTANGHERLDHINNEQAGQLRSPRLSRQPGLDLDSAPSLSVITRSSNHPRKKGVKCPACSTYFRDLKYLVGHARESHWPEEFFACLLCCITEYQGSFVCHFCYEHFQDLKDAEKHILKDPCNLQDVVDTSFPRRHNAMEHQKLQHPEIGEKRVGRNLSECHFCKHKFHLNQSHECDKKNKWGEKQRLKKLFNAKDPIHWKKVVQGWVFRVEGGKLHGPGSVSSQVATKHLPV